MNPFLPQKLLENNVHIIKQKRGFVQSKTRLPKFFFLNEVTSIHLMCILLNKKEALSKAKNNFQFLKMRLLLFIYIVTSGSERIGTGV